MITGLLIGAAIGVAPLAPVPDATVTDSFISAAIERGYPPCVTESDTTPCYWDAARRGNGAGVSFVFTGDEVIRATD